MKINQPNILFLTQDVGQGDAGAPLFTFDKALSTPEEQVGQTLIAIHSGGDDSLSGRCVKKENCHFYPKWWTKVKLT